MTNFTSFTKTGYSRKLMKRLRNILNLLRSRIVSLLIRSQRLIKLKNLSRSKSSSTFRERKRSSRSKVRREGLCISFSILEYHL